MLKNSLICALETLYFPLTGATLKEMDIAFRCEEQANNTFQLRLSCGFPSQPFRRELTQLIESTCLLHSPHMRYAITIQDHIRPHLTQMPGKGLKGVKNTIAVASGKGGVGKSTVTVNLATALARMGARVGILDADIYGPSIPMMLGEHPPVSLENDHYLPINVQGIQAMSMGYLTNPEEALIWRGPMLAKSLLQMLDITLWHDLDYLFIDLPPGTGDIQLSLVQKIPLTGAVVVTTPQNIATLDAQKAIRMFEKTHISTLGIIENMALHVCTQCGHQDTIFGQGGAQALSDKHQLPVLAQIPLDTRIREMSDHGTPSATSASGGLNDVWMKAALQTAIQIALKPINYAQGMPPIVVD